MTTANLITAWDDESIKSFAEGDDDVFVFTRTPLEGLGEAVLAGRVHEYIAPVRRDRVGFEVRGGLGELRLKSRELADDLITLVQSFLDQFDLPEARLRIEITRSQSCPKFHSDNVHVRLVTTYVGPTTEYQKAGDDTTLVAPLGGLVFLKGHRHPTHRDAVHHRSPVVPNDVKRLCVAIDY